VLDAIQDEYADRLNVVTLDVRDHRLLGMRYGIESVPAFIYYDRVGKEARRYVGQVITVAGVKAALTELDVKPQ